MFKAGVEPAGIDYWIERLNNPTTMEADFCSGSYQSSPTRWFNPKLVLIVRASSMSFQERAYYYLAILTKLIPNPQDILTWAEMNARLASIVSDIGFISEEDRKLPTNAAFLELFAQRSNMSLDEWNQRLILGNLLALLRDNIQLLSFAGPSFKTLCKPYAELMRRLTVAMPEMSIMAPQKNGLLIFTSHSRFGPEHANQVNLHLQERLFLVRHHLTQNEKVRNIVPLIMLKTLKAGNVVHAAIDFGPGNFNLESAVFGRKITLPDSSAWAAWKSDCHCEWRYLVANHESIGTTPVVNEFVLPDKSTVTFEEFTQAFLSNIGGSIETAMVDYPFSFGSYKDIWPHLVSTT